MHAHIKKLVKAFMKFNLYRLVSKYFFAKIRFIIENKYFIRYWMPFQEFVLEMRITCAITE